MTRSETISFRVTLAQKDALQVLARNAGQTLSEFMVASATRVGQERLDLFAKSAPPAAPEPRRRRSHAGRSLKPLSTPFLKAVDAAAFEQVIEHVASQMVCDRITVAVLLTHLAEAIGDVLAGGQVFRWPGFFVAGPYATSSRGFPCCLPRFQANPPLIEHVRWSCPIAEGRNRELDAHRRRRRPDRSGSLSSVMQIARSCYLNQDRDNLRILEDRWRADSPHLLDP